VEHRQLLSAFLKSSVLGMVTARVRTQEDRDPVKLMPDTHKLLFENEFARVIESNCSGDVPYLCRGLDSHTVCRTRDER
jgi:hypothetical protein